MGKKLKDLIEQAEDEDKTRAQLEKTIESLELKVAKLETKLKTKKQSTKIDDSKTKGEKPESEEIVILKELIKTQKETLAQNQLEKDDLEQMIEEYGRLENTNESLKEEISKKEKENTKLLESTEKIQAESLSVEKIESDLKNLKRQLNDLEKEKKLLEDINSTFQSKEISVEDLEKTIEVLKSNNLELKKENQKLSIRKDTEKAELSRIAKSEEYISYLEKNVTGLESENEHLKQKDAILLAKTINVMEQESRKHLTPADDLQISKKDLVAKEDETLEKSIEVVQSAELQPKNVSDFVPIEIVDQIPESLEPEVLNLEETASTKSIEGTGYRKKICPNCGNYNKAQIREIDDKTRSIFPGFYAKKYKCGQCATEWAK